MKNKSTFQKKIIYLYIMPTLLICGCATNSTNNNPVSFNGPPINATEKCNDLKTLPENSKMSDLIKIMSENYSSYYSCSQKNEAWNEWYKKIKDLNK